MATRQPVKKIEIAKEVVAKPVEKTEVVQKYEVLSNVKMNGKTFVAGETFTTQDSKLVQELLDAGVIKSN